MPDSPTHSHFGVYALIFDKKDPKRILLINKTRGPYKGMYDLPGGSPEPTELLEETLVREVKEETSCDVKGSKQIGAASALFNYTNNEKGKTLFRHIGVIYQCLISGTPRSDGDGEDAGGCIWLSISEVKKSKVTPFVLQSLKMAKPLTKAR
jgi:ADP-ribose pyrophosphatase YjhB (NUDIX family)